MLLGNHMAMLQELRQMRRLIAVTKAGRWAGDYCLSCAETMLAAHCKGGLGTLKMISFAAAAAARIILISDLLQIIHPSKFACEPC